MEEEWVREGSKYGTDEAVRTVRDLVIGTAALFGIMTTAFPVPRPVESVKEDVKKEWVADLPADGMEIPYTPAMLTARFETFTADSSTIEESIDAGEAYRSEWLSDYDRFVDAEPFDDIARNIYEANETDEERIRQVWRFVWRNVEYADDDRLSGQESSEVPLMPIETLRNGEGDCEDVSIVAASILEAMPADWDVDLVEFNRGSPDQLTYSPDHMAVYVETGEYSTFVEATNDKNMNPYEGYEHVIVLDSSEERVIGTIDHDYVP